MLDPATGHSEEANETAWSRGHGTKLSLFEWMDIPENVYVLRKFGIAMRAMTNHAEDIAATRGFDWASLPAGSLVVDVGGGVGSFFADMHA